MKSTEELYLNVGCGKHPLQGFVNIDRGGGADLRRDVTRGLPFGDSTVDGIFSEHFMEHLSKRDGLRFLRECRRVLKPGGCVRIAMPDLDDLVRRYNDEDWRGDGDMFKLGFEWVDNRCEMLNLALREWGHRWVYNEEELTSNAILSGLLVGARLAWGESRNARLKGLEYRPGSKLIMEFFKRGTTSGHSLPMVSVLIPAYKPQYFLDSLNSALAQTYAALEIVICDDSPDDSIGRLVRDVAAGDARVRYERNRERLGPRGNYQRCLELAEGDYIKFLNDDDTLEPSCVERMAEQLARHPEVTLVACRRRCTDAAGVPVERVAVARPLLRRDAIVEGGSMVRRLLTEEMNLIGEPTATMLRRGDAATVRPWLVSFGGVVPTGWGDLALWLSMLSRGDLAYIAEPLCSIRLHPGQWQHEPEIRAAASGGIRTIRRHAFRLGMYRDTRIGPALRGWVSGIRYRRPDEAAWHRKLPDLRGWIAFARSWVGGVLGMVRRVRSARNAPVLPRALR